MFLLFAYNTFIAYPRGGWDDFQGAFTSLEDAKKHVPTIHKYDSYHIVDLNTLRIVDER